MATISRRRGGISGDGKGNMPENNPRVEPQIRLDRLGRIKDWLEARRAVAAGPLGYRFAYRVAAIIRKTYVVCGDAATIADDTALMMIREMLFNLDGELLTRSKRVRSARYNKKKVKSSDKRGGPEKLMRR
jgi:hypothetical protein